MLYSICIIVAFLLALFVLINGPLWLITRLRIFNRGRTSPPYLTNIIVIINRLLGLAGLVVWLVVVNRDSTTNILLYGVLLFAGIVLLFNVPVWLISRIQSLKRGRAAPPLLLNSYLWFSRIGGILVLLCVPVFTILIG
jgi:hypothetical protein